MVVASGYLAWITSYHSSSSPDNFLCKNSLAEMLRCLAGLETSGREVVGINALFPLFVEVTGPTTSKEFVKRALIPTTSQFIIHSKFWKLAEDSLPGSPVYKTTGYCNIRQFHYKGALPYVLVCITFQFNVDGYEIYFLYLIDHGAAPPVIN